MLVNQGENLPAFSGGKTTIIRNREYITDIIGPSSGGLPTLFNNTVFSLNPGIATTFPWLSAIASSYDTYKFHGLVF